MIHYAITDESAEASGAIAAFRAADPYDPRLDDVVELAVYAGGYEECAAYLRVRAGGWILDSHGHASPISGAPRTEDVVVDEGGRRYRPEAFVLDGAPVPAGHLLMAASRALQEDAAGAASDAHPLYAAAQLLALASRSLEPSDYESAQAACQYALALVGRSLGSRANSLLHDIVWGNDEWRQPLKRRRDWLGP